MILVGIIKVNKRILVGLCEISFLVALYSHNIRAD